MKKENDDYQVVFLGNYFGKGPSFDGAIFKKTLSPTLLASNSHGNVPKFIVVSKDEKTN